MQIVLVALLCGAAQGVLAQAQPAAKQDDLDVTMQIIVDPDAKLPDEVVRKIPLPARSSTRPADAQQKAEASAKAEARAEAARELERGNSEQAKERAQDAKEQREQAGRSKAEEHRRDPHERPEPARPQNSNGRP